MSVFKDFPGLENPEKKFMDFQGPARALTTTITTTMIISTTTTTAITNTTTTKYQPNKLVYFSFSRLIPRSANELPGIVGRSAGCRSCHPTDSIKALTALLPV